ncbi:RDD family protein [Microbacterium oleivorans]|uniref:RDD family protein n=1 Tax=Microbacterium oleivorans TaxID=273677 RepID=UPI00203DC4AB|nr:RDD family protein [Microbacterium oleivorans]MCM3695158.1 RDD family protein [Microbacterium oleivorans]
MTSRVPATMRHRVLALLIDSAVAGGVIAVATGVVIGLSVATAEAVSVVWLLPIVAGVGVVWFLVYSAMQGGRGSVGMRFMGVRLEHAADDAGLGFGRALGRNLIWVLTGSVLVGLFSPLFDPSRWRRGWHDIASGAVVVDVVPATGPAAPVGSVPPADLRLDPIPTSTPAPAALSLAAPTPTGSAARIASAPAPAAAPLSPPSWAPASVPAHRRIARTLPVDVISTVPGVPHRDGRPASAESAAPPVIAILGWDDGTRHIVYEPTLFGRGPGQQPGRRSTAVRDETLSLSKTHFEIGTDDEGTWVVDRHSLNGVVIVRGGQPQRLVPGQRARIWSGDVLELGDRRLRVESAR